MSLKNKQTISIFCLLLKIQTTRDLSCPRLLKIYLTIMKLVDVLNMKKF